MGVRMPAASSFAGVAGERPGTVPASTSATGSPDAVALRGSVPPAAPPCCAEVASGRFSPDGAGALSTRRSFSMRSMDAMATGIHFFQRSCSGSAVSTVVVCLNIFANPPHPDDLSYVTSVIAANADADGFSISFLHFLKMPSR